MPSSSLKDWRGLSLRLVFRRITFSGTLYLSMPSTKPHIREEALLRKKGYVHIAGADEVGKGSWAGPLVAAAVILPLDFAPKNVNDSKQLTPRQREQMFVHITRGAVSWAVGIVSPQEIDRKGIVAANKKALLTALKKLHVRPSAVLVDAVPLKYGKKPVKAIIHGDARSLSIAAASIIAKVVRDALMDGQHRLYPQYGFQQHKGYGTAQHEAQLKRHGVSAIHRRSFQPMKSLLKKSS